MINVDSNIKSALLDECVKREVILRFPEAAEGELSEITSENIISDSFELTGSICDESEFVLGGCIASQLTIQVIDIDEILNNRRIDVFIRQTYISGELYPSDDLVPSEDLVPGITTDTIEKQIFSGKIYSSKRLENRYVREIIAYDDFYEASNTISYNYFKGVAAHSPNIKLGVLGETLFDRFVYGGFDLGTEKFNDRKTLSLTEDLVESVCSDSLTITDLAIAYCELNASFGYIAPDGSVKFLMPALSAEVEEVDFYSTLTFEDFEQQPISYFTLPYNKDSYEQRKGSKVIRSYYRSDNIITKCCTDIAAIADGLAFAPDETGIPQGEPLLGDTYQYRPFTADVFGRWWLEPGDKVKINTIYDDIPTVESFKFRYLNRYRMCAEQLS